MLWLIIFPWRGNRVTERSFALAKVIHLNSDRRHKKTPDTASPSDSGPFTWDHTLLYLTPCRESLCMSFTSSSTWERQWDRGKWKETRAGGERVGWKAFQKTFLSVLKHKQQGLGQQTGNTSKEAWNPSTVSSLSAWLWTNQVSLLGFFHFYPSYPKVV